MPYCFLLENFLLYTEQKKELAERCERICSDIKIPIVDQIYCGPKLMSLPFIYLFSILMNKEDFLFWYI